MLPTALIHPQTLPAPPPVTVMAANPTLTNTKQNFAELSKKKATAPMDTSAGSLMERKT